MKKLICLLLCAAVCFGVLAGCGSSTAVVADNSAAETTESTDISAYYPEVYDVEYCRSTPAVSINGFEYPAAVISYYYGGSYMSFCDTYSSYLSLYGLDTDTGLIFLDKQMFDENNTWKDYFVDMGVQQLISVLAFSDLAEEMGTTLTEDELASVDNLVELHREYAAYYEYDSLDEFLEYTYGTGMNEEILRAETERYYLAVDAYNECYRSMSYTDKDLDALYSSLDGALDYVSYAYCSIAIDADGDGTLTGDEASAAKATADAIAADFSAAYSSESDALEVFSAAIANNGVDAQPRSYVSQQASLTGTTYAEWVAQQTESGSVAVIPNKEEEPTSYYVAVMINHDDNNYATQNLRCIFLELETDAYGYTENSYNIRTVEANEILNTWKSGEATEESFAKLANEYSDDTTVEGGLYSNIDKYSYISELTDFAYGNHEIGDTELVFVETSSYAGFYILYYAGEGETAAHILSAERYADDWAEEFVESRLSGYSYEYLSDGYAAIGFHGSLEDEAE